MRKCGKIFSQKENFCDGIDGADGGKGGRRPPIGATTQKATAGADLEYNGIKYKGGKGGGFEDINGAKVGASGNLTIKFGGTGGGGAAYGADGADGETGCWKFDEQGNVTMPTGGEGADAINAAQTLEGYGCGGNGGHGGGGGGSGTVSYWWNHVYSTLIATIPYSGGTGGKGSKGTPGNAGCLIIYY